MASALALVFIGYTVLYLWANITRKKRPPLPPGPPPDPLLGHLRLLLSDDQEILFRKWGKEYGASTATSPELFITIPKGDIIHLHFPGRSIIVLNSVEVAVDLLEMRSSNYSDRSRSILFELMGWSRTVGFLKYGKLFRWHRRVLQQYLNKRKSIDYRPMQTREARALLRNLVSDDSARPNWLCRFSASIILQVAYGLQVTSDEDPYMKIAGKVGHVISNVGPIGNTPLEFFPFLQYFPRWFPGTYYAFVAREGKPLVDALHEYPIEQVKNDMAEGIAKPSLVVSQLDKLSREPSARDSQNTLLDIKGVASAMYIAGAETTSSTMSFFFIEMALYPECQARAQKEIDTVLGSGRLPEFQDRSSLPYVECIFQETLRWHPVVPLGIPHRTLEDDVYRGMLIPKGTIVIANTRAMTLDDRVYSNPDVYNPSRYLPQPEGNGEPYPSSHFGFGRRICPGRHLADSSIWIAIASILATLTISKAVDKDGKEITPKLSLSCGLTSQPHPYECRIRPRSEAAKLLISHADTFDGY